MCDKDLLILFIICKTKVNFIHCFQISTCPLPAWMHLSPRRPGRCSDGEHLLGALLSGTWYPARWPDALPQACGRPRRLVHHFLQWDWGGEVRPQSNLCWSGTHCHWSVVLWCGPYKFINQEWEISDNGRIMVECCKIKIEESGIIHPFFICMVWQLKEWGILVNLWWF